MRCEGGRDDFRFDIRKFEEQLDPNLFFDWLQIVERICEYKQIPNKKKVKLVTLNLGNYASIWLFNMVDRRVHKRKCKIKS